MNQKIQPTPFRSPAEPDRAMRIRVAVISSAWHREIVSRSVDAIRAELGRAPDNAAETDHFEVPLHARRLAASGRYDGIIACGFVVNGGIYRHEFVASAVIDGLMRVQLDSNTPVFSAVLTPRDFHDHEEHRKFFAEHFVAKGTEVARACLETLASLKRLSDGNALPLSG